MLPAQFRLKKKSEFESLFRSGKAFSCEVLFMRYAFRGGEEKKVGFSVGLGFSKKAAERNTLKRWMREAVRDILGKIKPGYLIVFSANPQKKAWELDYKIIRKATENLLKKAKLI